MAPEHPPPRTPCSGRWGHPGTPFLTWGKPWVGVPSCSTSLRCDCQGEGGGGLRSCCASSPCPGCAPRASRGGAGELSVIASVELYRVLRAELRRLRCPAELLAPGGAGGAGGEEAIPPPRRHLWPDPLPAPAAASGSRGPNRNPLDFGAPAALCWDPLVPSRSAEPLSARDGGTACPTRVFTEVDIVTPGFGSRAGAQPTPDHPPPPTEQKEKRVGGSGKCPTPAHPSRGRATLRGCSPRGAAKRVTRTGVLNAALPASEGGIPPACVTAGKVVYILCPAWKQPG